MDNQENSKNILNERYEKIKLIGQGAGGKIYLCKVLQPIEQEKNLLNKMKIGVIKKKIQKEKNEEKKLGLERQLIELKQNIPKLQSDYVVIKKFKNQESSSTGLTPDVFHEIKFMKCLNHKNVIQMIDIFSDKDDENNCKSIYIVMDFYLDFKDLDLRKLGIPEIKNISKQFIEGVNYIHKNHVLHRDIKPANTFFSQDGKVLLGDFGLSRNYGSPNRAMTQKFCTINYRAPEIFLGANIYSDKVDIWSMGVTIAELFIEWPEDYNEQRCLFPGQQELQVLQKIYCLRGTPNENNWKGCTSLPFFKQFQETQPKELKKVIPKIPQDGEEILSRMLDINPNNRPTAQECLDHPFFKNAEDNILNLKNLSQQWWNEKLQYSLSQKK